MRLQELQTPPGASEKPPVTRVPLLAPSPHGCLTKTRHHPERAVTTETPGGVVLCCFPSSPHLHKWQVTKTEAWNS